jgi:hypothetical protein
MEIKLVKYYFKEEIFKMNTCLSNIYLKVSQIDSRHIRFALMVLVLAASGGVILGLPIAGDVGI